MNKKPIISVVIPCFNQSQYLFDSTNSILDQSFKRWECIIVNDGSTDNTDLIGYEICKKDERFKYIFKKNGGLSSARNEGIKNAIGEFILLLDADDKFHHLFMEKALSILIQEKKYGVVTCWGRRFVGDSYDDTFKPKGGNNFNFLFKNAAIGTSLIRKKCWEEIGGYDENMKKGYEDWEFYIRLTQNWNVYVIKEVLFYYRQSISSMRVKALKNFDIEIKEYIFKKHKKLYVENYDLLIKNLLNSIEKEKIEKIKNLNRIEFKIGKLVLSPFRYIKSIFIKS